MKRPKKFRRIHRSAKILGAILLGALIFSGGVFTMPKKVFPSQDILEGMRLNLSSDFNYIDQWNKELSEGLPEFDTSAYLESFENNFREELPSTE